MEITENNIRVELFSHKTNDDGKTIGLFKVYMKGQVVNPPGPSRFEKIPDGITYKGRVSTYACFLFESEELFNSQHESILLLILEKSLEKFPLDSE